MAYAVWPEVFAPAALRDGISDGDYRLLVTRLAVRREVRRATPA
jgi:hypothetical protein